MPRARLSTDTNTDTDAHARRPPCATARRWRHRNHRGSEAINSAPNARHWRRPPAGQRRARLLAQGAENTTGGRSPSAARPHRSRRGTTCPATRARPRSGAALSRESRGRASSHKEPCPPRRANGLGAAYTSSASKCASAVVDAAVSMRLGCLGMWYSRPHSNLGSCWKRPTPKH